MIPKKKESRIPVKTKERITIRKNLLREMIDLRTSHLKNRVDNNIGEIFNNMSQQKLLRSNKIKHVLRNSKSLHNL
jgi:hypothetical protein